MKACAIFFLTSLATQALVSSIPMPQCQGKDSSLSDNTDLLCDPMVSTVFRGKPQVYDPVLPPSGSRTDVFVVGQGLGSTTLPPGSLITVHYTKGGSCPDYPYDQTMEVVIYGLDNPDGSVSILDCNQVNVFNCIYDQSSFVNHDCSAGGFPVKK